MRSHSRRSPALAADRAAAGRPRSHALTPDELRVEAVTAERLPFCHGRDHARQVAERFVQHWDPNWIRGWLARLRGTA